MILDVLADCCRAGLDEQATGKSYTYDSGSQQILLYRWSSVLVVQRGPCRVALPLGKNLPL